MKTIKNTSVLFTRSMRHSLRSLDTILTVTIMPIMIMLLFIYVLGGAIQAGDGNYINYLLPGILIIAVATGISYTSVRIFSDIQKGMFKRFHSMPVARSSILWAQVLTSLVSSAISLSAIILAALIMGFRSPAGITEWLAAAALLALLTLALTWLAIIPGLTAKTIDGAIAFSYPLIFLPFISSAFVPTETMPPAVRAFAENQPVTSIVEALRALLESKPISTAGSKVYRHDHSERCGEVRDPQKVSTERVNAVDVRVPRMR
jgi:ABC-2 type transport system permease protein